MGTELWLVIAAVAFVAGARWGTTVFAWLGQIKKDGE